ncbi:hypothetical protein [Leifsonia sp. AG29]|uniref:hypothetical protein n=1 Tax=Leifsonia sp. AG29 TaxID=2598860 RepID=UPI00131E7139|nr:hypothetical protein [Leifsonia sp. AG29]
MSTGPDSPDAAADPQALLADLVRTVTTALPPAVVGRVLEIERRRTIADRVAGRPGAITAIRLAGGREALSLSYDPGPRWRCEISLVYEGVAVTSESVALGAWLTAFARLLAAIALAEAGDAAASSRALQTLGLAASGSEIQVRDVTLVGDLLTLAARLGDRVPPEAAATVSRIADLLIDTLERSDGDEDAERLVRRTASVYLPDTLRAYLALPADWASGHVLPDGSSPADALVAQLHELEAAATGMREAALRHDASALQINGRFLAERFSRSRLDLS